MNWRLVCIPHEKWSGKEFSVREELENCGFESIPAQVPGNFELDLMRAGKLPDLYYSTNTLMAQELEDRHLWYYAPFCAEEGEKYLHFEGIDTYADIFINGKLVRSTDNMFLSYDVEEEIHAGNNEVVVHIWPTMLMARNYTSPAACNALKYNFPALSVRKASHMFGWDIMPRIISGGLWKQVKLCDKKRDRINEVYFAANTVDLENGQADMNFYVNTDLSGAFARDYRIRIEGTCKDSSFVEEQQLWHNTHMFRFQIADCQFWWPKNAGEPSLYDTTVTLYRGEEVCDRYHLKIGVRTVALDRTEFSDDTGKGEFCFRINGKKVFILGTNWVPLDAFHSQDSKRFAAAMELLDDIGCNMVRCWGGNVYESEEFFDYCDEHGIMVWQDFAMGCSVYPEDEAFIDRLKAEAVFQIKRLRNHVSLSLWAGDNECDCAYYDWNGFVRNPNQNILTRQVLKHAVEMHDYTRPYLPSSPYMSEAVYQGKGILPENHLWGPRDYFKGDFYKNTFAHFASETGYHGFNSPDSLERFLKQPDRIFDGDSKISDEYLVHATSMEISMDAPYAFRVRLAYDQVVTLFGEASAELNDFIRQSQISQAEAKKYFIEKFRIGKWKRTGIIWWNLLDGWPQVSDAVVDYYFVKKLAYHYIKRSQNPVCLMFDEPENGNICLVAVNDLPKEVSVDYQVFKVLPDSKKMEQKLSGKTVLSPDRSMEIASLGIISGEQEFYLIEWEIDGKKYRNHYYTNLLNIDYHRYLNALKLCEMDEFEGFDQ